MKKLYSLFLAFSLCTSAAFATGHTVTPTVSQHVTCPGGSDGKAYVTVGGGVGPFTYSWNSTPTQTTDTLFAANSGIYTCIVTDQNDMSVTTATVTINNGIGITASNNGPVCAFMPVQLFATNGSNFIWSGPNFFSSNLQNPTINNPVPGFLTYTLQATSSTGCVSTSTTNVFVSQPILISVSPTNASCNGVCDGSATVVVTGGTPPYMYSWFPGSTTSPNPTNLCAGTYTIMVTDAMGCVETSVTQVNQPTPVVSSLIPTNPSGCGACDGSIQSMATGGTPPYMYSWSTGATTANMSNLCPGVYTLAVMDGNGCSFSNSATLTSSGAINASAVAIPDTCGQSVGGATATVTGAQGSLTYLWQPGNYTTQNIANVPAGVYALTVSDTLCSFTTSVNIGNVGAPTAIATSNPANCGAATGFLALTAVGGTPSYMFSVNGAPFSANTNYTQLTPGVYTIIVQDANGCLSIPIANTVQNTGISVFFNTGGATCGNSNGTSTANANGGVAPYTFLWSNGSTSQTITGLAPGIYTCTITDNVGCVATGITTVNTQATVYLSYDHDYFNCGMNSLTAQANYGAGSYTYLWTPGGEISQTITNQAAGSYTCTVTDASGCIGTGLYYISGSSYSMVQGYVYADLNGNCTMDSGENSNQYMYVVATNASNQQIGWAYNYQQNGFFQMYLPSTAATYTLSLISPYYYNYGNYTFNCTNNIITLNGNCDTIQNMSLGYSPVIGQDLHVQSYCGVARPGFQRYYQVFYGNPGTVTTNATVKMHIDNLLTFAGSTPPPTAINGNSVEWNVGNLTHGQYSTIYVTANVPTIQSGGNLGTILNDSVWIEPIAGDNYVSNNTYACTGVIVGSYDPNFKEVFSENMTATGAIDTAATELYYTVHFQNTGSDTAFTIMVQDTISDLLELNTLEIIAASHNYTASILPDRTLQVRFDNILLVDSNANEVLSHGYFHYKIRTKAGLQVGDQINNTAAIYFDFNLPIITNTVETPVQLNPVAIKNNKLQLQASVYPNPANGNGFKIQINDASYKELHFTLYNVAGTKVADKMLPSQPINEISTAGLSNGIYFYQLINAAGKKLNGKIIIAN